MTDEKEPQVDWEQLEGDATEGQEFQPEIVTPAMLARRILWDVSPHPLVMDAAKAIGLPATSTEVEEKEHQECHARMMAMAPLIPYLADFAGYAARGLVGAHNVGMGEEAMAEIPEHVVNDTVNRLYPLIYQSSLSILAELLDLQMIHLPHMMWVGDPTAFGPQINTNEEEEGEQAGG